MACNLFAWMQRVYELCQEFEVKRFEDLPDAIKANVIDWASDDSIHFIETRRG